MIGADGPGRELHLLDYWRVLLKRRWVIYTTVTVVVATVALGSFLTRPVYTATTRLQIEENSPKVMPFQEVMSSAPDGRNDFYQTQYGLIQSRRVAGSVIANLHLADEEEYRLAPPKRTRAGLTADQMLEAQRIDIFLRHLEIQPVRNSRLVDVAFSSHDPVLAARAANAVAQTYIDFNTQVQYNTTSLAASTLERQISGLQRQIDAKEKDLQAYAREHGIVELSDTQNISMKNLNDLNDSYTRARATRIEKEARYSAMRGSDPGGLPEVLQSQLIKELTAKSAELAQHYAQLSETFKPDWPEMVRLKSEIDANRERLASERQAIYRQVLGMAESAYRTARNEEERLKAALDQQKHQSQEAGLTGIQYNNLKAEIANKRSTLEALLKRQAETSSSAGVNELAASNVRVVDLAEVPTRKSSPKIKQNLLLGLLTGLMLGLGLAFFFEYMDKSIKTPEEIVRIADVPSIGLIPALRPEGMALRVIRGNGLAAPPLPPVEMISHDNPKSKLSEAFRELRTALLVSQAGGPPRTIMIASAQPGEGKTSIAVNLAITLAQIGRLVLLVDADLRKPRLHKIFATANDQGLSTYLSGSGNPWLEPRHTPVERLFLIPSGPLPPNPADLLNSERFVQIQKEFEEQGYDHVIFDSPPLLAVADPSIMAARMEAVILVVHAGATSKDAVVHAAGRLRQVKGRILGAVLNRADLDRQGYYYGYSYKRYYGEEEPPAVVNQTAVKKSNPTARV
jgi:polysaccharide biosynthesis transport protein